MSSAPVGAFISYSTSPGGVARDGEGRNSPYAAALVKHMTEPGQPVEQVFKSVRQTLATKSGGKQVPWELSSLQGNFFFTSASAKTATDISTSGKMVTDTDESKLSATNALDVESRKLEEEQGKLEKERELLEKKKALAEERRRLKEEQARLEAEHAVDYDKKIDIGQLQGVWKDEGSRSRNMRIRTLNGQIDINCWDRQDNEVTQVSNISWDGNALSMVMYTPSTRYRNNVVMRVAGPNKIEASYSGSSNSKSAWTRLSN